MLTVGWTADAGTGSEAFAHRVDAWRNFYERTAGEFALGELHGGSLRDRRRASGESVESVDQLKSDFLEVKKLNRPQLSLETLTSFKSLHALGSCLRF